MSQKYTEMTDTEQDEALKAFLALRPNKKRAYIEEMRSDDYESFMTDLIELHPDAADKVLKTKKLLNEATQSFSGVKPLPDAAPRRTAPKTADKDATETNNEDDAEGSAPENVKPADSPDDKAQPEASKTEQGKPSQETEEKENLPPETKNVSSPEHRKFRNSPEFHELVKNTVLAEKWENVTVLADTLANPDYYSPTEYEARAKLISLACTSNEKIVPERVFQVLDHLYAKGVFQPEELNLMQVHAFKNIQDKREQKAVLEKLNNLGNKNAVEWLTDAYTANSPNKKKKKPGHDTPLVIEKIVAINKSKKLKPEEKAQKIDRMIKDHMGTLPWLGDEVTGIPKDFKLKDQRLCFLLDLHEKGVKLPEARTMDTNPFVPIREAGKDTVDSTPIINWIALRSADTIIKGRRENPRDDSPRKAGEGWDPVERVYRFHGRTFPEGTRPDFYYGFYMETKDETAEQRKNRISEEDKIERLVEQIREIEMMPLADKDARLDKLVKDGGLLAHFGSKGPGNELALIRLCFHLRGKLYAGRMNTYYSQNFHDPNKSKTGAEANIVAAVWEIMKKQGTTEKDNDNDVEYFHLLDVNAYKWKHKLDKKLRWRRALNGAFGLRLKDDGKYEVPFTLATHPLRSIKDSWRWFRYSVLGNRWNYHVYNPSFDKDGNFTWGGSNYVVPITSGGKRDTPWVSDLQAVFNNTLGLPIKATQKAAGSSIKAWKGYSDSLDYAWNNSETILKKTPELAKNSIKQIFETAAHKVKSTVTFSTKLRNMFSFASKADGDNRPTISNDLDLS